jgi:hypothetical protein
LLLLLLLFHSLSFYRIKKKNRQLLFNRTKTETNLDKVMAELDAKEEEIQRLKSAGPARERAADVDSEDKRMLEELKAEMKAKESELSKVRRQ